MLEDLGTQLCLTPPCPSSPHCLVPMESSLQLFSSALGIRAAGCQKLGASWMELEPGWSQEDSHPQIPPQMMQGAKGRGLESSHSKSSSRRFRHMEDSHCVMTTSYV